MASAYKMSDAALYPYLLAMREELYTAQRTIERFWEFRDSWHRALDDPDQDIFAGIEAEQDMMGAIELLLTVHARLSLYLFPAYDKQPARGRGRRLRDCLGIRDDHPIGNRDARNGWMHVDQEVDRAVFDRGEDLVEAYRVVRSDWPSAERAPRGILTIFNSDSLILKVAGQTYDLRKLNAEIDEIGVALFRAIPDFEHRLNLEGRFGK